MILMASLHSNGFAKILFFLSPELLQMQDIGYQKLDKLGRDDGHVPSWLGGLTKSKPALQPPQPGNRSFRRGCPSRCHRAAKTGRGRKTPHGADGERRDGLGEAC